MNKIHQFAMEYLLDWFPDLGSYQAFNNRLNRVSCVMVPLLKHSWMNLPQKSAPWTIVCWISCPSLSVRENVQEK